MANWKRVLAVLLSLVCLTAMLSVPAFASEAPTYTVTVHYVDTEGNTLQESDSTEYPAGTMYDVIAPAIADHGFAYAEGETSGLLTGNVEVTLVYEAMEVEENTYVPEEDPPLVDIPEEQPPLSDLPELAGTFYVTVNYVDTDGNVIHPADVTGYPGAALYDVFAAAIDGYGFAYAEGETSGVITGDVEVTLVYENLNAEAVDVEEEDVPLAAAPEIPTDNSPATGDTPVTYILIGVMVISGICLAVVLFMNKRAK